MMLMAFLGVYEPLREVIPAPQGQLSRGYQPLSLLTISQAVCQSSLPLTPRTQSPPAHLLLGATLSFKNFFSKVPACHWHSPLWAPLLWLGGPQRLPHQPGCRGPLLPPLPPLWWYWVAAACGVVGLPHPWFPSALTSVPDWPEDTARTGHS